MKTIKLALLAPILLSGCSAYDSSYAQVSSSFYSNVPGNAAITITTNRPYDYYNGPYYYYGRPYYPNYGWGYNYNRPPPPKWNPNKPPPPHWNNNRPRPPQNWNNSPRPPRNYPPASVNVPRPPGYDICQNRGCAKPWVKP